MDTRVAKPKDLIAGFLFLILGAGAIYIAGDYNFGGSREMGPGFFPVVLGYILCLFAVCMIAGSFFGQGTPTVRLSFEHIRSIVLVLAGVVLFGVLIRSAGMLAAMVVLLGLGTAAMRGFGWRATVAVTAILAAFSVVVFVYLLGQPIPMIGPIFGG